MDVLLQLISDPRVLAILSPLLVAVAHKMLKSIPKPLLPILSAVFGSLLAALSGADPVSTGAMSGLAGIGVREIADQATKAVKKATEGN